MHTLVIGTAAFFLYLIAALLLGLRLRSKRTDAPSKWRAIGVAAAAVAFHGWVLYLKVITPDGLNLAIFSAASLLTWFISLLLIIICLSRPMENLGIAVFPSASLALILEHLSKGELIMPVWGNPIEIHILFSIIAYSILSIAAVQAILLAIQDKQLRNKQLGGFVRALPPLQVMESLLFKIIALGFLMQSVSLVTGIMFVENIFAQHLVHKTALSIVAWFFFGTLLWGRFQFGWRGRTAIRWTLSGFIALALSYIGSKLVLEVILGRS